MKKPLMMVFVLLLTVACAAEPRPEPVAEPVAPDQPLPEPEETAMEAVREMLAAADAGDWGRYVDGFYGERHKFASPADRDALVARYEGDWGPRVVEALRRAQDATPRIEGGRAIFEQDGEPVFVLHADDEGSWKFHL